MIEERTLQLINADLDGELGQAEKDELEAILESSAEARLMKAEFQKLANLLDNAPEQTPPLDLSARILGQVALSSKPSFTLTNLFSSFQPATAGLAFAAGLLLTVGFYEISPRYGSASDTTSMVGTMVAGQQSQRAESKDRLSFEGSGVSGNVSVQKSQGMLVLNFELDSDQKTEIEVSLSEAGLSFGGIAHVSTGDEAADESYKISGGTLRVVNQGRQAFSVFLPYAANGKGSSRDIGIEISTEGAQVFSGNLRS